MRKSPKTINMFDKIVNCLFPGQSCQSRQRGQGCFFWSAARSASVHRAREPQESALGARSLPERESLLICLFATSSWSLWKINLSNLEFNSKSPKQQKTKIIDEYFEEALIKCLFSIFLILLCFYTANLCPLCLIFLISNISLFPSLLLHLCPDFQACKTCKKVHFVCKSWNMNYNSMNFVTWRLIT